MAAAPVSAVVLSIDRLGASFLGPYGNTWLETPAFSQLAAESVLLETVIADSPELNDALSAWWTGRHALDASEFELDEALASRAARAGLQTILITDEPSVAADPLAASFARQIVVPAEDAQSAAEEPEDTAHFRLMAAAIEVLATLEQPFFLWIHARGMAGAWDAPLPLRQQFADEDDPEPPDFVMPPERRLEGDVDPDEVLGLVHAYAGQVALVDLALSALLTSIDGHLLAKDTLLAVTSPRGYPLGEHHRVGPCDDALYSELLHVPLLLRLPERQHALARLQSIVQPHRLFAAVAEECRWSAPSGNSPLAELDGAVPGEPQVALSVSGNQRMLRTPAWHWLEAIVDDHPQRELYAKPDDRFEANEIASLCEETVELLAATCDEAVAAARAGRLAALPPLPELLARVWR